jgi:hypothetical protein
MVGNGMVVVVVAPIRGIVAVFPAPHLILLFILKPEPIVKSRTKPDIYRFCTLWLCR